MKYILIATLWFLAACGAGCIAFGILRAGVLMILSSPWPAVWYASLGWYIIGGTLLAAGLEGLRWMAK